MEPKSRFPEVSAQDRYLIAVGIGVLLLLVGALFAWNERDSLPITAAGGVLVFFGLAAGTLKAVKLGKEGAELEFETTKLTAVAATLERAADAAKAPVREAAPPSLATQTVSLEDAVQQQAARNSAALAQAAAAIRASTPEEFGHRLADLAAATGVTLNYSYDEANPGEVSNLKVWTSPRRD